MDTRARLEGLVLDVMLVMLALELLLELVMAICAVVLRSLDLLLVLLGSVRGQVEYRLTSATLSIEVDGHRERGQATGGRMARASTVLYERSSRHRSFEIPDEK